MYEDFIEKKGTAPGPVSVILAGVHGNERCGVEAFEHLLPELKIEKGVVFFGYGNPRAIERDVRQTDINLNRLFRSDGELTDEEKNSYEYERVQLIKEYFDKADALLDLHATTIEGSPSFAIGEPHSDVLASVLPTDIVVYGFDTIEPGGTEYYLNQKGHMGLCIECGYYKDPKSVEIAEKSIMSFLQARGHIEGEPKKQEGQTRLRMFFQYLTKTDSFVLAKVFQNFEEVEEGQLIGTDGDEAVRAPASCRIVFAHNCNQKGSEGFLLGRVVERS